MLEMRIHGRGGQGIVTMADFLGKAALRAGKVAQTLPFFGVERRGAAIKACIRIADEPILLRSMSYKPHVIVLMQENMLDFARLEGFDETAEGLTFIINSRRPVDVQGAQWIVDAQAIAREHGLVFGDEAYINVPMTGAIARVVGLPLSDVEAVIREYWPGGRAEPNLAAARQAYESIRLAQGSEDGGEGSRASVGPGGSEGSGEGGKAAPPGGVSVVASVGQSGQEKDAPPIGASAQGARQPLSLPVEGATGLTGAWSSLWPALDKEKCTGCLLCWIYCPEGLIDRESRAVDVRYCKGCGLCARECPVKAIEMRRKADPEESAQGGGKAG